MAKPRIFISSTFYDLRQIRTDLARFIVSIGYEPIRNDVGNIPYGKEDRLEEYCYKEIQSIDILISIIGGRYGTKSFHGDYSISQMEMKTALDQNKQVFIFIEKNVMSEFQTFKLNKEQSDFKYYYADNVNVYKFIEEIYNLPNNNPIHPFETSEDISDFLKEQWAGLLQRSLQEQARIKEVNLMVGLEQTSSTLNQLIIYLTEEKKGTESAIRDILISNHPLFEKLAFLLGVPYRIFFLTIDELTKFLVPRGFTRLPTNYALRIDEHLWQKRFDNGSKHTLHLNPILFDELGNLRPFQKNTWNDNWAYITEERKPQAILRSDSNSDDDLPF